MNISKAEQRVLHVLAQGGHIRHTRGSKERGPNGRGVGRKIIKVLCVTREGHILSDCTLAVFDRLRKRRLIASSNGGPYRATRLGRVSVRAQLDNR
ncbi:YjhX family toxin [Pelagibius sp.]|uniref:YjhX family toxin n=1 Tax=Pelagibius sp. TaxID=1931238 RepID=UPI003BAE62E5